MMDQEILEVFRSLNEDHQNEILGFLASASVQGGNASAPLTVRVHTA